MENKVVQTSVEKVIDLDIDNWLSAPGADSVVTPSQQENEKPSILSKESVDLSFIDEEEESKETNVPRETIDEIVNNATEEDDEEEHARHKSGLVNFLKKRIESKEMFAFDDFDESKESIEDYLSRLSEKDIDELWQANINNIKQEVASETPKEFFESLPEELQYAAKYVMDGGKDIKGLFQALSQVEQVRSLDPENEDDQSSIIKSYLRATNFGNEDEIEEEISTWKDLGLLEKKAKQFKPKLDLMQEEIVNAKLAEQERLKQQQEQAAQAYVQNVFEALRPSEINGLKLDKKTQAHLYNGLVQPQYPSISGKPTNMLGYLLEKYQFIEPNYPLIAETLWLLSNPEEYRNALMSKGSNKTVEETVRQLKIEQNKKNTSSYYDDEETTRKSKKLHRPQNIFKRTL